jgi:hypothetical protein
LVEAGVLWLVEAGVLWLVETVVVESGLLSRKYSFLVAGAAKVQNGQDEHQSERLEFLDGPKGTIQVRQTRIASRRKTGLGVVGITERKPQLDRYTSRSKPPLTTLCLRAKSAKSLAEIGTRTNVAILH